METKKCPKCGRVLPLDAFYRCVKNKDGLQAYCKECSNSAVSNHKMTNTSGYVPANGVVTSTADKPLNKCTDRELFKEIKARGYHWEKLTTTVTIKYESI